MDAGNPIIYAFWHGCLLPLTYTHKHLGIDVLVSQNKDGELIARVLHGLGFHTIRGSTSRHGAGALKALVRASRAGRTVGITPDGPRGPRHEVQDGVVFLAAMTGTPIVPLAADAHPAWRLRSWDRFLVPRPFGRGNVVLGPLRRVPRHAATSPGEWRDTIRSDIHDAAARARDNVRG